MALWEGATPADLLDDLGNAIAQKYRRIELALERKLRRYLEQAIEAPTDLSARLAAVTALREQAARLVATMPPERVAAVVAQIAAGEVATEVARQLLSIPSLAGSTVTSGGLWAVAASQIELTDTLRALNARIHRAPADAYQAMTAAMQPDMLIGRSTWEQVQRRQVDQYLADGITGFIDRSDRRWRIGSYAEMATRTAAARAWRDQSVASMRENGITTFTPVLGSSACGKCAAWAGKVLSDGRVGRVEVPHALTGEATPVHIDATLAEARAAGWGHPNCRCMLIPSLPGLERRDVTTHDPEHERARDTMRALEREVRAARRDNDTEGVEAAQRALRDHTREHGLRRRYWREQLEFSGG